MKIYGLFLPKNFFTKRDFNIHACTRFPSLVSVLLFLYTYDGIKSLGTREFRNFDTKFNPCADKIRIILQSIAHTIKERKREERLIIINPDARSKVL